MKTKIVLILLIGLGIAAFAGVTDKLDELWQLKQQQEKAITARAIEQNVYNVIVEADAALQELADNDVFDLLDPEIKRPLQVGWRVIKDAKAGFLSDPNVVALFEWRP